MGARAGGAGARAARGGAAARAAGRAGRAAAAGARRRRAALRPAHAPRARPHAARRHGLPRYVPHITVLRPARAILVARPGSAVANLPGGETSTSSAIFIIFQQIFIKPEQLLCQ